MENQLKELESKLKTARTWAIVATTSAGISILCSAFVYLKQQQLSDGFKALWDLVMKGL